MSWRWRHDVLQLVATCTFARHVAALLSIKGTLQLYLLADTTYSSCAVDEVAAEHMDADCIIHYGHAALGPVRHTPTFFVLPRTEATPEHIVAQVQQLEGEVDGEDSSSGAQLLVLLDQAYMHVRQDLCAAVEVRNNTKLVAGSRARFLSGRNSVISFLLGTPVKALQVWFT